MGFTKIKNIKGLTLVESLVCLVIIGIGFIGVNQMISYAINSVDRSVEKNKINFLSETAVEDILADRNNAAKYSFKQSNCSANTFGSADLAAQKKSQWAQLFLAKNQMMIDGNERKLNCLTGDEKVADIQVNGDRTAAKFSFKNNKGKSKKFIGVVVK